MVGPQRTFQRATSAGRDDDLCCQRRPISILVSTGVDLKDDARLDPVAWFWPKSLNFHYTLGWTRSAKGSPRRDSSAPPPTGGWVGYSLFHQCNSVTRSLIIQEESRGKTPPWVDRLGIIQHRRSWSKVTSFVLFPNTVSLFHSSVPTVKSPD